MGPNQLLNSGWVGRSPLAPSLPADLQSSCSDTWVPCFLFGLPIMVVRLTLKQIWETPKSLKDKNHPRSCRFMQSNDGEATAGCFPWVRPPRLESCSQPLTPTSM